MIKNNRIRYENLQYHNNKKKIVFKSGMLRDRITSQFLNIIQFFYDTLKITDTVTIGIQKRLGINFIKDCIIKPFCHSVLLPVCFIFIIKTFSVFFLLPYHRMDTCTTEKNHL